MALKTLFRGSGLLSFEPSSKPIGLLIMLHGCTQNAEDFATGTRMGVLGKERGYWVVFPEQGRQHHSRCCWNWYRKKDQQGGEVAELVSLVSDLQKELKLSHDVTFLAGLSAGGAMTSNLVFLHPSLFAAFAVHSGLPPIAAESSVGALAAMQGLSLKKKQTRPLQKPGIILHGNQDAVVVPGNSERLFALTEGSSAVTLDHFPGGVRHLSSAGSRLVLYDKVGHAWSGGSPKGSHTDPSGPDASSEILDFFGLFKGDILN